MVKNGPNQLDESHSTGLLLRSSVTCRVSSLVLVKSAFPPIHRVYHLPCGRRERSFNPALRCTKVYKDYNHYQLSTRKSLLVTAITTTSSACIV